MIEDEFGIIYPSILMIDQEQDNLALYRQAFDVFFPRIRFFAMSEPMMGIYSAYLYCPDVIVTEIHFSRYRFFEGERLIEQLRRLRPDSRIIIYSVYGEQDEDILYRYHTVFGIDAYFEKAKHGLDDLIPKVFELLGEPSPYPEQ